MCHILEHSPIFDVWHQYMVWRAANSSLWCERKWQCSNWWVLLFFVQDECNFDAGFCQFSNDGMEDDFDWSLSRGSIKPGTGPMADQSATAFGTPRGKEKKEQTTYPYLSLIGRVVLRFIETIYYSCSVHTYFPLASERKTLLSRKSISNWKRI